MNRSISRAGAALGAALLVIAASAAPALACGGLIGPNGAVNLLRTTTLAAYHDGEEHYVTAFQFAGGGGAFGSLTPLPGIPSSVEKGGDWTLQRLVRETEPRSWRPCSRPAPARAADSAEELMKVRIDALDITVLRGGAAAVGTWATDHGFRLPPDAPEVLDFYAARSPIFLAAVFDADAAAARGQAVGDGTPVHVTIPTDNPWVPLRILALGKTAAERVDADRLPPDRPAPGAPPRPDRRQRPGLGHSAPASGLAARRPPLRPRDGLGPVVRLADARSPSTPRHPTSPSTWRSTPRAPARRRGSWPVSTCRAPRPPGATTRDASTLARRPRAVHRSGSAGS